MKLNKKKFMETELGRSIKECIELWDRSLTMQHELEGRKYESKYMMKYKDAKKTAFWCLAQWEAYQKMIRQFYEVSYCFTRTDEYFGVVTEDESNWLFKVERGM